MRRTSNFTRRRLRNCVANARSGAAATELALTLPLLLLIVFGCVDFGRGIAIYIAVGNAARVGVEYGATHQFTSYTQSTWESDLRTSITEEMENIPNYNQSELSIGVQTSGTSDDLRVTVEVSYPFHPVTSWPGVAEDLVFQREVTMRQFR